MDYDYAQLERIWLDAGGPADQMSRAAATAEAESGGNPLAAWPGKTIAPGSGTWNDATGLWQILGAPAGNWKASELTDPLENARMAVAKYQQGGNTWEAWTGDLWSQHYRGNVPPAPSVPGIRGGGSSGQDVPYRNPLRAVTNLTPERVDMGVDYSGTGPVYALGPGVITSTENSGWPGGNFIAERLTEGPAAGHYVYVAEDIRPSVSVGQHVDDTTVIGQMYNGGSGIETGWASPPGTGDALGASQFSGSNPTAYGAAYSKLLSWLGAPGGIISGTPAGSVPKGWFEGGKDFSHGGGGGITTTGIFGDLGSVGAALQSIADAVTKVEHAIEWWFVPNHLVRIGSGIFGAFFVAWGMWAISRTGRPNSATVPVVGKIPVPVGGEISPPLGILAVTVGSVGLFIAFHNLPDDVTGIGSLMSYLQQQVKGGRHAPSISAGPSGGGGTIIT